VIRDPLETKYYASDEPLQEGMRHFYAGDFGLAQKHFQAAVERTPRDATAWVGTRRELRSPEALRPRRPGLRPGAVAQRTQTVQIYNNRGYSYLLRGDLRSARRNFLAAYELEPENPTIKNNLVLLSSSAGIWSSDTVRPTEASARQR
jgi:Flp pilus assembly protein TadD